MQVLKRVVFVCLMVMLCISTAKAELINKLERVDIDIQVNTDGSADIREVWNTTINKGSEGKKELKNLNGSKLTNFSVTDEVGTRYLVDTPWDSGKNRLEKYHFNGYIQRLNGDIELYWGLGDYGDRAYILEYSLSDYIKSSRDSDFLYSNIYLENGEYYPSKISVSIKFPNEIDLRDRDIRLYGFKGSKSLKDNTLRLETDDLTTNSSTYISMLMRVGDRGQFSGVKTFNKRYKELVDIADKTMGKQLDIKPPTIGEIVIKVMSIIVMVLIIVIIVIIVVIMRVRDKLRNRGRLVIRVDGIERLIGDTGKYDIGLSRDTSKIYEIYLVGLIYGLVDNKYSIISSILIKWYTEGIIRLDINGGNIEIKIERGLNSIVDEIERGFYGILEEIGLKEEGVISNKDIDKWLRVNRGRVESWVDEIILGEAYRLEREGKLEYIKENIIIRSLINFKPYKSTDEFMRLGEGVQKYIKYLTSGYNGNNESMGADLMGAILLGCHGEYIRELNRRGYKEYRKPEVAKQIVGIERVTNMIANRLEVNSGGFLR